MYYGVANAADPSADLAPTHAALQAQIDALQQRLDALEPSADADTDGDAAAADSDAANSTEATPSEDGIRLGGAVRFQYSHEGYTLGNRKRGGDLDFDIFRLDLNGSIGAVELSAQYRWFHYMDAVHHAWVGYTFNPAHSAQLGIAQVPFGNLPFNSHSYFFSSNYYLGLEDAYHLGARYHYTAHGLDLQLGFFKNDALGGVDGYVGSRADSYTYNLVGWRDDDEGIFDDPQHALGSANTGAARLAYTWTLADARIDSGVSVLRGQLYDADTRQGRTRADAVHINADWRGFNLQLQATRYTYSTDANASRFAVGAYGFYDSIAAAARSHTANLAYAIPVQWGPIRSLTLYSDYSLISHKSGALPDTWMHVSGVAIGAGGLFTYIDWVRARNQPFIGGSMAADDPSQRRLNINVGYYF